MEKAIYAVSLFSPTQDIHSANQSLCTSYKRNKLTDNTKKLNQRENKKSGLKESSGNMECLVLREEASTEEKRYIMKYEFYQ